MLVNTYLAAYLQQSQESQMVQFDHNNNIKQSRCEDQRIA